MTPELQAQADAAAAKAAEQEPKLDAEGNPIVVEEPKEPVVPEELNLTPAEEKTPISVQETGNAKLDDIGKLLSEKGIESAQSIMDEYSKEGTLSVASQAVLVDKLGDSVAAMVIKNLEDIEVSFRESAKASRKEVFEYANTKFGGEDAELTWKQMQEFARGEESGLSADDITAMNSLLAKGGLSAQLVIDKLHTIYTGLDSTSTPADLLQGDVYSNSAFKPLSKTEYVDQLREAKKKYGYESMQVKQLQTRREQSRARGY